MVSNPLMPRGNPRDWNTGICSCFEDIPTCKYFIEMSVLTYRTSWTSYIFIEALRVKENGSAI